ncbi:MAG: restriction endonuclease [Nanobdellota archaeon]
MRFESQKGIQFEKWVVDLLINTGKKNVRHDVTYTNSQEQHIKAQFDIIYGKRKQHYVECKYRNENYPVSFMDIAVFSAKLELFNINYKRGLIVTNNYLEPRAKFYGMKQGIKIYEREDLEKLHTKQKGIMKRIFSKKESIEDILRQYHI